jgi:hypothetical protein
MADFLSRRPRWRTTGNCPKCGQPTRWEGKVAAGWLGLGCGHNVLGMEWELQGREPREWDELAWRLERMIKQGGYNLSVQLKSTLWALQNLEDWPGGQLGYANLSLPEWLAMLKLFWPKGHQVRGEEKRSQILLLQKEIEWKWKRYQREKRGEK